MADVIHKHVLVALGNFFPARCTVQVGVETQNELGEVQTAWQNLAGHVAIPCRIMPQLGREVKVHSRTYYVGTHRVALKGFFPQITPKMRALLGGQTFDILLVEYDSQNMMTYLGLELVQ